MSVADDVACADLQQPELQLLGAFAVHLGISAVVVPPAGRRVLALLALLGGVAGRPRLAGTLWPDSPSERAQANLRGALWRLPESVRAQVDRRSTTVALAPGWRIDLDLAIDHARHLGERSADDMDGQPFCADLLPDWDEDWLVVPRERHRQLRLHALEDLAAAQIAAGRALDAVDTALQAVAAEPLRESAQLLLLQAHLAAGNRALVVHQYDQFRTLLLAELGVEPSPQMRATLARAVALQ
jgi:DNA-binding SARP family transcriptional activator